MLVQFKRREVLDLEDGGVANKFICNHGDIMDIDDATAQELINRKLAVKYEEPTLEPKPEPVMETATKPTPGFERATKPNGKGSKPTPPKAEGTVAPAATPGAASTESKAQ